MKTLDHKLIIYDSNCRLCSFLRSVVLKVTSIPESKIKSFASLDDQWLTKVDPNKFKNGMALIDTAGGHTIYGTNGIGFIFSSQYKIADFLFRFSAFRWLFNVLYKTTAYNRYIVALPKSAFECDCFPDKIARYRLSYIVIAVFVSIFLTTLFGISIRGFVPGTTASMAAVEMLLIAGSGWLVQMLLAILCMKDKRLDYIGHLGTIMVAGLLILVPSIIFYSVTGILNVYVPLISVIFSSAIMLRMHISRARYLKLSPAWTISWFLLLQSTAAFWVYFFHVK